MESNTNADGTSTSLAVAHLDSCDKVSRFARPVIAALLAQWIESSPSMYCTTYNRKG